MIVYLFNYIQPFRRGVLSMLTPSNISRFLVAVDCEVTATERERYIDILDDIFDNPTPIIAMQRSGLTMRIFGADLTVLENRLLQSHARLSPKELQRPLHIFVLVTNISNGLATLIRDYRPYSEQELVTS